MSLHKMTEQIQAAWAYEQLFVPSLFAPWTSVVAETAEITQRHHVLDIACGTGVLAREARFRAGQQGHVCGLDITPGMLEVARQISPDIHWYQGDAIELPFQQHQFDRVVSQFGLMFFSDRIAALKQMRQVLKPGGLLTVAVWDSLHNLPVFSCLVDILDQFAGRKAGDALRAPFNLGNIPQLQQLAEQAELDQIQISTYQRKARFPNLRSMVEAELRGWLPVMNVMLDEMTIKNILNEAEQALGGFVDEQNRLEFPMTAHLLRACNMHYV